MKKLGLEHIAKTTKQVITALVIIGAVGLFALALLVLESIVK